jgi:glycosyltransferase involved in cell wall biosynthesis
MDKILVIVPIYNKENFLEGAIESIIQQTHKNVELVLIDDCSTDKSLEIAKSYEHLNNVTVLQNSKNRGCYYTRNRGLEYFKDKEWDYFTIHDADDLSDITRFETLLKYFKKPNILGLKSTYVRVDTNLEPLLDPQVGVYRIRASEGIAMFPRETFETLGYYDNTKFSGDTDYWKRCEGYCKINPKYTLAESQEKLYLAIVHGENLTVQFPISSRGDYFEKSFNEIRQMFQTKNFYRDIFE